MRLVEGKGHIPIPLKLIQVSLTCVFSFHLSPLNDDAWTHETSFPLKCDMKQCRFWWRWQLITAGSALVLTAVESLCLHMCTLLIQLSLQSSSAFFPSVVWYLFNNLQSKHSIFILCTVFILAECVYIIYSLFASSFALIANTLFNNLNVVSFQYCKSFIRLNVSGKSI